MPYGTIPGNGAIGPEQPPRGGEGDYSAHISSYGSLRNGRGTLPAVGESLGDRLMKDPKDYADISTN